MAAPGFIFEATAQNFRQLVIGNSGKGLVVVDFWAPWVGPSLRQRETLTRLAQEYRGRFLVATVNTDRQKALAEEYGVRSLPSMKLFRQGRVAATVHGVQSEADYRQLLERHLAPLADRVQTASLKAWQAGEHDKAIQMLVEGAMAEPDNLALPALLAKLLMQLQRHPEAHAVLSALPPAARQQPEITSLLTHLEFLLCAANAPPAEELEQRIAAVPTDLQARYQLASLHLVGDRYEAAMDQLLAISRDSPDFLEGIARKGMAVLLGLFDPEDPRAKKYRTQLFRLNY